MVTQIKKSITRIMASLSLLVLMISTGYGLDFNPTSCSYSATPPMANWTESYDNSNVTSYCQYNNSVFYIKNPVKQNFAGQFYTNTPADLWTTFWLEETGNVRNVEVNIEYYEPSFFGICLSHSLNYGSLTFNSPWLILLANDQQGFSPESVWDSALYSTNNPLEAPCDQWNTISVLVQDFTNDWGSAFNGRSKTLGSFGFEMSNIYVRKVEIVGSAENVMLWP